MMEEIMRVKYVWQEYRVEAVWVRIAEWEWMVRRLTAEYPVERVCQVLDYPCRYGGPSKGREEQ